LITIAHDCPPCILRDIPVPNSNINAHTVDAKVTKQAKKKSRVVDESSTARRAKRKALSHNNINTSSNELPSPLLSFGTINSNWNNT
jgi:hypothetical protein